MCARRFCVCDYAKSNEWNKNNVTKYHTKYWSDNIIFEHLRWHQANCLCNIKNCHMRTLEQQPKSCATNCFYFFFSLFLLSFFFAVYLKERNQMRRRQPSYMHRWITVFSLVFFSFFGSMWHKIQLEDMQRMVEMAVLALVLPPKISNDKILLCI